jgi:hypothetical protein
MDSLDQIANLLEELRTRDTALRIFGAKTHRYRLYPVVGKEGLWRFAKKYGVTLPEDYRGFLTRVGNGGAGPGHGLFRLGEMDQNFGLKRFSEDNGFIGVLRQPFPHTKGWNLPKAELKRPKKFASLDDEDRWNKELDQRLWDSHLVDGAIPICHHGCAVRTWLVLTGPERGHVWLDGRADGTGLQPHLTSTGRHQSFGAWYLAWLERSLAEARGATSGSSSRAR